MTKSKKDQPPTTRTMATENKTRSATKKSHSQNHTIVKQLRLQVPTSQSKRKGNDDTALSQYSQLSNADTSGIAPIDMDFESESEPLQVYQQDNKPNDSDENSNVTENMVNINKV